MSITFLVSRMMIVTLPVSRVMTITLLVSRVMMTMNVSKVMMKKIGLRSSKTFKNFHRSMKKT
eukprot:5664167-Karenia_brevis.AAC.1